MSENYAIEGCRCTAESNKAILVVNEDCDEFAESTSPGPGRRWIPKSQIHDDSEVYKQGTSGTLIVTQWLAEQEGWV